MNDKVDDWDKPIEYVDEREDVCPAAHLGGDDYGTHAVLATKGSRKVIMLTTSRGTVLGDSSAHVRNKREYAYQWLVAHDLEGDYVTRLPRLTEQDAQALHGKRLIRPIEETKREVE